jgi:protein-arginine deiminase
VVNLGHAASGEYVSSFRRACQDAGRLAVHVVENPRDPWIQDELQWGYTYTPRAGMHVALHTPRARELERNIPALLAPEVGYLRPFSSPEANSDSLDYGGNIEVSPRSGRQPFGRVYYGGQATPRALLHPQRALAWSENNGKQHTHISQCLQEFFKRQKADPLDSYAVQEPIALCTDWLTVGHVDEMVCFVRANNRAGFALLHASPRKGLEILEGLRPSTALDERYGDYTLKTVQELLEADSATSSLGLLGDTLSVFNARVQRIIDYNVAILQRELALTDDQIIELPVLFHNSARSSHFSARALTPGMGNLSAMGQLCLIPDPFIPEFRAYVKQALADIGQRAIFIDNWDIYHRQIGEVHCGSNTRRQPLQQPWWAASKGVSP